ncbi:hypothetical protein BT69DRAFT_1349038 [Atractiella rhizophila]|nr:hypothetical protein BT69DRAFT_1349038 [Atractiella rhizophila]
MGAVLKDAFEQWTTFIEPPYPPVVKLITDISRFAAYLCIMPIVLLVIVDLLGWFLFKVLWRPLGYYHPRLRKFKDPDPIKPKTTTNVDVQVPSTTSSGSSSPTTLKRHKTLPILRTPSTDFDYELRTARQLRRSGSLESLASVGTEGPMVSWDRDDVSEWEREGTPTPGISRSEAFNRSRSPSLLSVGSATGERNTRERKIDKRNLKMSRVQ